MSTNESRRGVVAEFRVGSTFAADALAAVPASRLEIDRSVAVDDGAAVLTAWAHGIAPHLQAFERALRTDDGVQGWRRITDPIGTRTPYRIETTSNDPFARLLTGFDGFVCDAVGTREGWDVRVLVSDRTGLAALVETWRDEGLTIDLTRLRVPSDPTDGDESGLTDSQHEVLVRAFETGYFDVPRETTLDDVGEEFDISGQSASERLRRGLANLLAEHVVTEDETSHDTRRELHEPNEPSEQRPEGPA